MARPESVVRDRDVDHVARASARMTPPASLHITFPWAVLVRDNARHGVIKGRIVLTKAYRKALENATLLAHGQCKGRIILGRVAVSATFYEPDRSRARDLVNYAKLAHDALNGIAYTDDSAIDDVRWIRGPVDAEHPRVELTITALPVSPSRSPAPRPIID